MVGLHTKKIPNYNLYEYDWVDHKENFINPANKNVHRQKIERAWRSLKGRIPKSSHGSDSTDYIVEFLYRSRYHNKNESALNFEITINHLKNNPFSEDALDLIDY